VRLGARDRPLDVPGLSKVPRTHLLGRARKKHRKSR
jgi:hypothetical protein